MQNNVLFLKTPDLQINLTLKLEAAILDRLDCLSEIYFKSRFLRWEKLGYLYTTIAENCAFNIWNTKPQAIYVLRK